jgi:hypothetical protein
VSSGGKFKLYTVANGLIFNAYLVRRFSFERMIHAEFPNIFVLIDFIRSIKKIICLKSKLVLELPIGGLNFGI